MGHRDNGWCRYSERRERRAADLQRVLVPGAAGVGCALLEAVCMAGSPAAVLAFLTRLLPALACRMADATGEQQQGDDRRSEP